MDQLSRKHRLFLNLMFLLNLLRLAIFAGAIRFTLSKIVPTREVPYDNESVGRAGYYGWIESDLFGVLAFRRNDGSVQYRW